MFYTFAWAFLNDPDLPTTLVQAQIKLFHQPLNKTIIQCNFLGADFNFQTLKSCMEMYSNFSVAVKMNQNFLFENIMLLWLF